MAGAKRGWKGGNIVFATVKREMQGQSTRGQGGACYHVITFFIAVPN